MKRDADSQPNIKQSSRNPGKEVGGKGLMSQGVKETQENQQNQLACAKGAQRD